MMPPITSSWTRAGTGAGSAEVFHEHDVAAAVVLLGIQNPSPVGRHCHPRLQKEPALLSSAATWTTRFSAKLRNWRAGCGPVSVFTK